MKKIYLLSSLFVLFIHTVKAQENTKSTDSLAVKKDLFVANLIFPGITYERAIGTLHTISATAGLTFSGFVEISSDSETQSEYSLNPAASLAYRYYYNFKKRQEKGKNIKYNSGNYISLYTSYFGAPFSSSFPKSLTDEMYYFSIGPVWGFQRTYKKRLHLNLDLGLGYTDIRTITTMMFYNYNNSTTYTSQQLTNYSGINIIGNFRLGICLGKM